MRSLLAKLPVQRTVLCSIILTGLGVILLNLNNVGVRADPGWKCPTNPPPSGCTIEGCHDSLPQGGGYQVCLYSGSMPGNLACPPLHQCESDLID